MLDVHPPHQAAHTWKDFFIHIATIVVGLIIAVGLEQTVEAIHQHRERHELMEQLDAEHRQVLNDAEDSTASRARGLDWFAARMEGMEAVLTRQQPYQPPARPALNDANDPHDSVWRAAKASGRTSILSQQVVIANSEIEHLLDQYDASLAYDSEVFNGSLTSACGRLPIQPGTLQADYTHADKHDLKDCLVTMMTFYRALRTTYMRGTYVIGAEKAIIAGETDIDHINSYEVAERNAQLAKLHPAPIPQ
jgi:hypothetical protein